MRQPGVILNRTVILLEAMAAISSLAGGITLVSKPDGSFMGFKTSLLDGTPFDNFLVPGLILTFIVGGSAALGTIAGISQNAWARAAWVMSGSVFAIWIIVQIAMVGLISWLQPTMLGLGLSILVLVYIGRKA